CSAFSPVLWTTAGSMDATANQSSQSSRQLFQGERFLQAVVRAGVKADDTVVNAARRGEQEDGPVAPSPQQAADVEGVWGARHDVDDDHVIVPFRRPAQDGVAAVDPDHRV